LLTWCFKVILHQFWVKKFPPWKFNLEYGGTFTKLFMHVSSQNMFRTIRNLQIHVHVYRPRHSCVDWLTFGCFVPMISDHDLVTKRLNNHGCWGKHAHIPDNYYWGICLFHVVPLHAYYVIVYYHIFWALTIYCWWVCANKVLLLFIYLQSIEKKFCFDLVRIFFFSLIAIEKNKNVSNCLKKKFRSVQKTIIPPLSS